MEFLAQSPLGLGLLDDNDRIVSANGSLAAMLDSTVDALADQPWSRFWLADEAPSVAEGVYRTVSGQKHRGYMARWEVNDQRPAAYVVALFMTHQQGQRASSELEVALQLQLRELSAVFAHHVKNPIAGIGGALTILQQRNVLTPYDSEIVDEIMVRLHELNRAMNHLLEFGRPILPRLLTIRVTDLLRDSVRTLQEHAEPTGDRVRFRIPESELLVRVDPLLLKRSLLHILENALEAVDELGEIRVAVSVCGNMCAIEVAGTGAGCGPDVQAQMFRPFFTTKSNRFGLGLSLASRILEAHGGTISCLETEGTGLVIRLLVPLAQADTERSALPRSSSDGLSFDLASDLSDGLSSDLSADLPTGADPG